MKVMQRNCPISEAISASSDFDHVTTLVFSTRSRFGLLFWSLRIPGAVKSTPRGLDYRNDQLL